MDLDLTKQPCAGGDTGNAAGAGALMRHRQSRNAAMQQNGPQAGINVAS